MIPQSPEDEKAVIGSILLDNNAIYKINLSPEDFFSPRNKSIYEVMCKLRDENKKIDVAVLSDSTGIPLEKISEMVMVATASHVQTYAKIVKESSYQRELMQKAYQLIQEVENGGDYEKTKKSLLDTGLTEFATENVRELCDRFYEEYGKPLERGLMTGIKKLDEITSGFRAGELVTIAANPGIGKTNLLLNIASHVLNQKKKVLYVNLEMDSNDVLARLISIREGLDSFRIRRKTENPSQVFNALGELDKTGLKMLNANGITSEEIAQHAFIEQRKNGLDVLFVDYLNEIRDDPDEKIKIDIATGRLKDCALKLKIPVIVPYQVDKVARREGQEPKLEDGRGSTTIGDRSGVALALINQSKRSQDYDYNTPEDDMRLYVMKNRHGADGFFMKLKFNKSTLRFKEDSLF